MKLVTDFKYDCQARGLTTHTIQTYVSNVKKFLELFPEPRNVTINNFITFLGYLRDQGLQGSTLKGYFASLSALFDYLVFNGAIQSNPIPSFRKRYLARIKDQTGGDNERQLISIQQMQILFSAAECIQDKAILLTLAKTGMRRGELLGLLSQDIDLKNNIIHIPSKAKRSNRLAFIDDELRQVLQDHLTWRSTRAKNDWLWISSRGGRIHKDYPGKMIASLGIELGIHCPGGALCYRLTPHCFRHFFTTHLFRAGMDPQFIMFLRGDSMRSKAWQIYNHIDPEQVRTEYEGKVPRLISFNERLEVYT